MSVAGIIIASILVLGLHAAYMSAVLCRHQRRTAKILRTFSTMVNNLGHRMEKVEDELIDTHNPAEGTDKNPK